MQIKNRFAVLVASVAGCAIALPALAQVAETEPNETKVNADTVGIINLPAANGPALTGTTTGSSLVTLGLTSADTFRVQAAAQPLGIYRNRLLITTTGTAGHTGSIRGLAQSAVGTITAGSDSAAQTSSTATTPARSNQWYSFGKQEQLYYRVTGAAATTAPYIVNYEIAPVTPIVVSGTITAGSVNIRDTGSIDADFWVYNSNLDPIVGFGLDEPEAAGDSATLTPGTYYVAMARFNGANNLASAAPETFAGTVLDFPNIFTSSSSSTTSSTAIPVFTSSSGVVTGSTTTYTAGYDVAWYQFTVSPAANPIVNSVVATPGSGGIGTNTVVVASVTPAPDLVAITSVSLDASQINGGTVTLLDNGVAPDAVLGDNNWTGTATVGISATLGSKVLTAMATDASARTASGTGNFNVVPANDACGSATVLSNAGPYPFNTTYDTTGATLDGIWTGCSPFTPTGPDLWYSFTAPGNGTLVVSTCNGDTGFAGTQPDTLLGITSTCGTAFAVCEDDQSGACGLGSSIDLNVTAGTTYRIAVRSYGTAAIVGGLFNLNFIAGTPLAITATSTSNSTIFTNGAPMSTIVTATVQNASLPPSTGVTVSLNAAAAGLGTISLLDDGIAPDVAIDNIYTGTISSAGATLGIYSFPITVTDQTGSALGSVGQTIDSLDETGELVGTANLAPSATSFNGRINSGSDVDMYRIFICDPANFSATTVGGVTVPGTGTGSDTALYLFAPNGNGISYNDDVGLSFNSLLDNTQVASLPAGEFYLAVAYFGNRPSNASAQLIWNEFAPTTTVPPTGPGAPGPVASWDFDSSIANYTLTLTGVSLTACPPVGPVCNDIDFNNDGSSFDPQDIEALLSVFSEGPCIPDTQVCDSIDFNNDGGLFDPCDINSFLTVFAEGPCTPCGE